MKGRIAACLRATAFALAASAAAGVGHAQEPAAAGDALGSFAQRVDGYMALRHQVEQSLPPLEVSPDPERIRAAAEGIAAAIRAARDEAEIGDLFTADVRLLLRLEIARVLHDHRISVEDVLADFDAETPAGVDMPPLTINGPFPWAFGTLTSPLLLAILPALPEELEYKFIRRDLLLVDVSANLIVDILPDALPAADLPASRVAGDRQATAIGWS